jgi:hypothetical protein
MWDNYCPCVWYIYTCLGKLTSFLKSMFPFFRLRMFRIGVRNKANTHSHLSKKQGFNLFFFLKKKGAVGCTGHAPPHRRVYINNRVACWRYVRTYVHWAQRKCVWLLHGSMESAHLVGVLHWCALTFWQEINVRAPMGTQWDVFALFRRCNGISRWVFAAWKSSSVLSFAHDRIYALIVYMRTLSGLSLAKLTWEVWASPVPRNRNIYICALCTLVDACISSHMMMPLRPHAIGTFVWASPASAL